MCCAWLELGTDPESTEKVDCEVELVPKFLSNLTVFPCF